MGGQFYKEETSINERAEFSNCEIEGIWKSIIGWCDGYTTIVWKYTITMLSEWGVIEELQNFSSKFKRGWIRIIDAEVYW